MPKYKDVHVDKFNAYAEKVADLLMSHHNGALSESAAKKKLASYRSKVAKIQIGIPAKPKGTDRTAWLRIARHALAPCD
jgi:hypothetical protein